MIQMKLTNPYLHRCYCIDTDVVELLPVPGSTYIGLLQTCLTIHGRETSCFTPDHLRSEWILTFLCITAGILCITVTIILLGVSYWMYNVMKFARWLGFVASKL